MPESEADDRRTQEPVADEAKAAHEKRQPTASQPGGFENDPDDPTNPNEAIERSRRQVRP